MTLADAVNIARRESAKLENDLVSKCSLPKESRKFHLFSVCTLTSLISVEDYHVLTADECQILAERIKITSLPRECKQYIGKNRGKLDSAPQDPTAIAFEGMSGASSAAAARAKGRHSHAVIQRRYTTNKSKPGESK